MGHAVLFHLKQGLEGAVAQSVERATPGEKVLGSTPTATARSIMVGSAETEVMPWSPHSVSCVAALSDFSIGARPRYS